MNQENILFERFKESRTEVFLTDRDNTCYSYGAYWANAEKMALSWQAGGLQPGDVVALKMPSDISISCAILACAIGGFVACPIVANLDAATLSLLLAEVKPKLVIDGPIPLAAGLDVAEDHAYVLRTKADTPSLITFTTGSTGTPKAICHKFASIIGSAKTFADVSGFSKETRLYHVLPMGYMAGIMNSLFAPMMAGASVLVGPLFSAEMSLHFWGRPLEFGANTLSVVPSIAYALARLTRSEETIGRVKTQFVSVQCTSAPLTPLIRRKFNDVFGLPLRDCYGITECGGPLTVQSLDDATAQNNWTTPAPAISCSLRGDQGNNLWIKSPFAMLGYLVDGEIQSPFDADGYFDTGDTAAQRDGAITITGREKDIIVRGGININPLKITRVISLYPGIEDVAVLGAAHDFWGEQIVACIVAADASDTFKEGLAAYLNENLPDFERPDRTVVFDVLPKSFAGKLDKAKLRPLIA